MNVVYFILFAVVFYSEFSLNHGYPDQNLSPSELQILERFIESDHLAGCILYFYGTPYQPPISYTTQATNDPDFYDWIRDYRGISFNECAKHAARTFYTGESPPNRKYANMLKERFYKPYGRDVPKDELLRRFKETLI